VESATSVSLTDVIRFFYFRASKRDMAWSRRKMHRRTVGTDIAGRLAQKPAIQDD
jgi:hypothetical protein